MKPILPTLLAFLLGAASLPAQMHFRPDSGFGPTPAPAPRVASTPAPIPFTVPPGYQVTAIPGGGFLVMPVNPAVASGTVAPGATAGTAPDSVPPSRSTAALPSASPTPTPMPEAALPPSFSFKDFSRYIVIIQGDKASGTGFIANYLNKPFLFTNTHVISGNPNLRAHSLDGRNINLKGLSVAESYDLSLFQQDTIPKGLDLIKNADTEVSVGDDVVVLGNSLGGGVVTEIPGKVTGVGPDLIEVDAKFVSGNSGSPVIHVKTGKVIGIATYSILRSMEGFGKDSKFNNVERRFAYRVDNVPTWLNTSAPLFLRESSIVSAIEDRTTDVWNLAEDIAKNGHITEWDDDLLSTNSLHQYLSDFQSVISDRNRSREEIAQAKETLFYWINCALTQDLDHLNYSGFVEYNRKKIDEQKEDRTTLKNYFNMVRQQLANDPNFNSR